MFSMFPSYVYDFHTSHGTLYLQIIATRCATVMSVVKKLIGRNIELIARHGAMKTSEVIEGGNYMHELARERNFRY